MVTMGVFPFQGKTHMVEPGIEPGTSWLIVRNSDHQATRLVLRLNLEESIKSRQSRGLWLIMSVCLRPSISMQAIRPLSILKNWTRSLCLSWHTEILTFSFRRFNSCSLQPNSSAFLLGKSRSLIRSFNSSCVIRWNSLDRRSAVKSASIDVEGCGVFSCF